MHAAFVAVSMIATLGIKTKIINKMTNKKEQAPANDVLTVSEAFITKYKKPIVIAAAAVPLWVFVSSILTRACLTRLLMATAPTV